MSYALRLLAISTLGMVLLPFLSSCVVPGVGYEQSAEVGYGVNYYEPSGLAYGGWAPGYHVGPPRGGEPHPAPAHFTASRPAYRPAPPSRPIPSIPTHSRPPARNAHGK